MTQLNASFVGTIPETYDRHLGPIWFEPHAADLAARLPVRAGLRVLELACGTGRLTRHLLGRLPADGRLVATDLNEAMVRVAKSRLGADPRLEWRVADAAALEFAAGDFDQAACQFGVMFFPDKPATFREIGRVLKPGGELAFNTWGPLEENALARIAHETIAGFFPGNPPDFYLQPFGYHDPAAIRAAVEAGGFARVTVETVRLTTEGPSAAHVAVGVVQGSPVLNGIQQRGTVDPAVIVRAVEEAIIRRYGAGPVRDTTKALVVTARKPPAGA